MNTLGISMIVAGVTFLFSGLIFLLPIERRLSARGRAFEESQKEIERHLEQMRNERGEAPVQSGRLVGQSRREPNA